jgi:hypothetical protein
MNTSGRLLLALTTKQPPMSSINHGGGNARYDFGENRVATVTLLTITTLSWKALLWDCYGQVLGPGRYLPKFAVPDCSGQMQ